MALFRRVVHLAVWLMGPMAATLIGSGDAGGQQTRIVQKDAQASLVTVPPEVPADAVRYSLVLAGNNAGVMALWKTPDGARHNFFGFNDRGRGPRITTRIVVNRAGIPIAIDASGEDYFKGPVDEHFRLARGKATWSNKAEKGAKQIRGPALYVPIDAALSSEMEVALLAAPGGRLPLLPEGEARIERVLDHTVGVGGKKQKVTLYEETGLRLHARSDLVGRRPQSVCEGRRLVSPRPRRRGSRLARAAGGSEGSRLAARP